MTSPIVILDTETTGLALTDDIWEFAAIRRDPDGIETELHMFVEHAASKCNDLPESFRQDHVDRYRASEALPRGNAARAILGLFEDIGDGKPHVVGAVPNFDTERIARLLLDFGYLPPWHYHLIDVENLAVGYLQGRLAEARALSGDREFRPNPSYIVTPPWDSDDLSRAVGVDPEQFERHTAMGDVRWARAIYDTVMGGES